MGQQVMGWPCREPGQSAVGALSTSPRHSRGCGDCWSSALLGISNTSRYIAETRLRTLEEALMQHVEAVGLPCVPSGQAVAQQGPQETAEGSLAWLVQQRPGKGNAT